MIYTSVLSFLGLEWNGVDVVEDLWNEEELDEHLTDVVSEEEWPEQPEVPGSPHVGGVSVEEEEHESNNVSGEWDEHGN